MRNRRKRRNSKGNDKFKINLNKIEEVIDVKKILYNIRFYVITIVLIVLIIISILFLKYKQRNTQETLAKQKAEIESQTQEIYRNIQNSIEGINERNVLIAKLSFVGDILCDEGILSDSKENDEYNFDSMFNEVSNYTKDSDYSVGTLETNFTDNGYSGSKKYNSPVSFLKAIGDVGIDMVSLAHNHCLDYGKEGLNRTIENIRNNEISITGIPNNQENSDGNFSGNIKDINGIKIAFLSYSYGLSNENEISDDEKSLVNIYSEEKVNNDFEYIKDKADFVVVIMHWGEINKSSISNWQLDVKKYLLSKGANVILRFASISG